MLLCEAKREAPAQAELRPTCAGASGLQCPAATRPFKSFRSNRALGVAIGIVRQKMRERKFNTLFGCREMIKQSEREFAGMMLLGEAEASGSHSPP